MDILPRGSLAPITRKLETLSALSDGERNAIAAMPIQVQDYPRGSNVISEGDHSTRCFALIEGFSCTVKLMLSGERQIIAFHIPGDMPDLHSLHHKIVDVGIQTITPCTVGFVRHEVVHDVCARYPRIATSFWRATLDEAAISRAWVTNFGQRKAPERLAHLACELLSRMQAVGLSDGQACRFPMTQTELADAIGMSPVHVNRSLQALRARGLISFKGQRLQVLNWPALKIFASFDPTYLHLNEKSD